MRIFFSLSFFFLLPSTTYATFDHSATFDKLEDDLYFSIESFYDASTSWYISNYNMAKYGGYQELLQKFDGYLPTGDGLVILHAESNHTPDTIGTVNHLFDYEASDTHSEYVADILSTVSTYPLLYTKYTTYSPLLNTFHTADTADLRTFFEGLSSTNTYPATDYLGAPVTPAKLLNISNTNGGSDGTLVRKFDRFVELNDMVACTAFSSLEAGNWTTSGMSYNSIVVGQPYVNPYAFDGAEINDHGEPRYKPDLIAFAKAHATSYSTPTVCSAAAMMLERVNVDPAVTNGSNSVVIKAILMAGATRFNYKISTEWGDGVSQVTIPLFTDGEWVRESDSHPTSYKYGAGAMNVLASYNILDAGEFDANATSTVANHGWDFDDTVTEGQTNIYNFTITAPSIFSSVLAWHRHIDDNLDSHLPNYSVTVYDDANSTVALSNNLISNIELIEIDLASGNYRMAVTLLSADGVATPSYGLAWITKERVPEPAQLTNTSTALQWNVSAGAVEDYKYRVEISTDSGFSTIETEVYTDNAFYTYQVPEIATQRYFRVSTYPKDSNVTYFYPSASVSIAIDPCPLDSPDDSDSDGVCDSDDQCAGFDDSQDGDSDGVADGCDICPQDNPDDTDSDGVCESDDQCPGFDDTVDSDGDGVADGCDVCPSDNPDDTDGDGVCNSDDQCPADYDKAAPGQCGCNMPEVGTDADSDGILDCNDTGDTDGDGVSDQEEIKCSTDPTDPAEKCGAIPSVIFLLLGD